MGSNERKPGIDIITLVHLQYAVLCVHVSCFVIWYAFSLESTCERFMRSTPMIMFQEIAGIFKGEIANHCSSLKYYSHPRFGLSAFFFLCKPLSFTPASEFATCSFPVCH